MARDADARVIDAPEAVELRTLRQRLETAEKRVAELETDLASARAEADALRAAPAPEPERLVAGQSRLVLKTTLRHNGQEYPVGSLLPFDPKNPPKGCDGLVEGVHYHAQRVLVAR